MATKTFDPFAAVSLNKSAQPLATKLQNSGNLPNTNFGANALALSNSLKQTSTLGTKAKSPTDNLTQAKPTLTPSETSAKQATPTPPAYDNVTGLLTAYGKSQGLPEVNAPKNAPNAPTQNTQTKTEQPAQDTGLYGSLVKKSADAYKTAGDTNQIIKQAELDATHNPEYSLDTGIGRAGMIQQNYGLQGQNALTQAAGLASLAGDVKPQANASFFGSPVTGGLVGTGLAANGLTGNALVDTNVQQALKLVQAGTPINNAEVQKLLSISPLAQQAFNQTLQNGGGYNPATQSATATQNANQAVTAQGAAFDLDTQIKNLDNISTLATNFLQNNKLLNPTDNPNWNASIGSYVGTFNDPAAKLQYNMIMGDISKFTSAILASNNGQIPTAVTAQLQSFDPSTLSASQLIPYLQNLKILGDNQLSVLQTQYSNSANSSGGYTGAPATVVTTPPATPKSTGTVGASITNPYIQGVVGLGMNAIGGIAGLASKLFGLFK